MSLNESELSTNTGNEENLDDDDIATALEEGHEEQPFVEPYPLETQKISEYAQVVFQNVAESYKPGKHLECHYCLTPVITPHQRDWVGIFKVGWSSTRQYVAYDWSPLPKDHQPGCEYGLSIIFNSWYLPGQEDGEFYQFCYIDSDGKMRGASTPFQFLEHPIDDFMQIDDASMDILMIQNKRTFAEENLERVLKEKDSLMAEKEEIETEKQELLGKLEALTHELSRKEEEFEEVMKDQDKSQKTLEAEHKVKLASITAEVEELKQERLRAEESLKQMEDALLEMQKSMTSLEQERAKLKKDLKEVTKEREEFKGQFASSESNNEVLRMEIDKLKLQLSELSQQQQVMKESEGLLQMEKQKIEHQLLVAAADKEHKSKLEEKARELHAEMKTLQDENAKLKQHIETLQTVHEKLSHDLERAVFEKQSAEQKQKRKEEDFRQEQMKAANHMRMTEHKFKEDVSLLQDQIKALKDGMNKLAKENEFVKKSDGSDAASQIVVKKFKDKVQKSEQKYKEELQKRLDIEKKLAALEVDTKESNEDNQNQMKYITAQLEEEKDLHMQHNIDLTKEVEDLKARLNMAKEEYQGLYTAFKNMEEKYKKMYESRKGEKGLKQPAEPEIIREVEVVTQSAQEDSSAKPSIGEDSRDRTMNMEELAVQLADLTTELEKRKKRAIEYQKLYEEERVKRKQKDNLYKELQEAKRKKEIEFDQKYKGKKEEIQTLREKLETMQMECMRLKHINESLKFDQAVLKDKSETRPGQVPQEEEKPIKTQPPASVAVKPNGFVPRGPPAKYSNPCDVQVGAEAPLRYPNPYGTQSSVEPSYSDVCYPPQLPTPLVPTITPEARVAELKAKLSNVQTNVTASVEEDLCGPSTPPSSPVTHPDPSAPPPQEFPCPPQVRAERPTSPAEFHDAVEFHDHVAKLCPDCGISFPGTCSDQDFAKHIQTHLAKQCSRCHTFLAIDISDEDYRKHLEESCRAEPALEADHTPRGFTDFCPMCSKVFTFPNESLFCQHVEDHFK